MGKVRLGTVTYDYCTVNRVQEEEEDEEDEEENKLSPIRLKISEIIHYTE